MNQSVSYTCILDVPVSPGCAFYYSTYANCKVTHILQILITLNQLINSRM